MPGGAPLNLLVDASSLIYRAFFAIPDSIRARDGSPVNAAYGFCEMLARLIGDLRPRRVACCLDADWRPEWRVDLLESYKAHRVAAEGEPEDPVEAQIRVVERVLRLLGIAAVGAPGCEAEDVIATLLRRLRGRTAIVSGDRDLFQLVRDPTVWILYPRRGVSDLARVDEAYIRSRYGIPGRAYADFAVLRGDPSDGLPGVRGIGEKTAALLIGRYGSLKAVLRAAEGATAGPLARVAAERDYLARAARVVRMKGDCPVGDVDLTLRSKPPTARLRRIAADLGIAGPVERLAAAVARASPK